MKSHPRIRKTIKWGGAAVTVLLVVASIWSGWGWLEYQTQTGEVGINAGGIHIVSVNGLNRRAGGFVTERHPDHRFHWPGWRVVHVALPSMTNLYIPLWMLCLISIPASIVAWRLDVLARRRAPPNLCKKCEYNRDGLEAGAVCPECGSPPA